MTAFIRVDNRTGQYQFSGSSVAQVDTWCMRYFQKDSLHFVQTLTVRFHASLVILRVISGDRFLVRARVFQATIPVALNAFRLDPQAQISHHAWFVVHPAARSGLVSKPLMQNL